MNAREASTFTPIWTHEMGRRLRIARQCMQIDQSEFGERIGLKQHQVSKMENGAFYVIPVSKLKAALESHFKFVVFGDDEKSYDLNMIHRKYYNEKLNRGGTKLTDREIRNRVYGEFRRR